MPSARYIIVPMNTLNTRRRAMVISALVEGNSVRATSRMTGVAKGTILKLLGEVGRACEEYQNETFHNLNCRRIQCDEIWNFCYAKQKNVPADKQGQFGFGDVWTWVAIDADSKLIPTWAVGKRDAGTAYALIQDLAGRMANRIQLTTDGLRVYVDAVESAFGSNIDYSMLIKMYGGDSMSDYTRYSPADCIGTQEITITGRPKPEHVSTSFVERQNLTMRMQMRRFTRLTNAFSKKVDNLKWSVAIHFMHYNFCRVHQTLRVTPAMEAGIADHVWTVAEIVSLLNRQQKIAA
jgi:IS1 family transposase